MRKPKAPVTCGECGVVTRNLGNHLHFRHPGLTSKVYFHRFVAKSIPVCSVCGGPVAFRGPVKGYRETCGMKCRSALAMRRRLADPERARANSDNARDVLASLKGDPKFIRRQSEASSKAMSVTMRVLWQDPEYRKVLAPRGRGTRGWHESPKAGKVYYRSSYEKLAFLILDQLSVVESYEVEPLLIEYKHPCGAVRGYYPDILVKYGGGRRELIEIKPERFLSDPVNKRKARAARKWCRQNKVDFSMWTEAQLGLPRKV